MKDFESLIINRRSTRKYKSETLTPDEVHKLLQAALLAPSSKNCKPWEFIIIEDKAVLQQLSASKDSGGAFIEGCALAIVVIGDKTITDAWIEDAAIAAAYMQLQAEDLGIGSCWCHIRNRALNGYSSNKIIRQLLSIPDIYDVLCIIGFGYKDQERKPNDLSKLTWEKVHVGSFRPSDRPLMA